MPCRAVPRRDAPRRVELSRVKPRRENQAELRAGVAQVRADRTPVTRFTSFLLRAIAIA